MRQAFESARHCFFDSCPCCRHDEEDTPRTTSSNGTIVEMLRFPWESAALPEAKEQERDIQFESVRCNGQAEHNCLDAEPAQLNGSDVEIQAGAGGLERHGDVQRFEPREPNVDVACMDFVKLTMGLQEKVTFDQITDMQKIQSKPNDPSACVCGQPMTISHVPYKGCAYWICDVCSEEHPCTVPRYHHQEECNFDICLSCGDNQGNKSVATFAELYKSDESVDPLPRPPSCKCGGDMRLTKHAYVATATWVCDGCKQTHPFSVPRYFHREQCNYDLCQQCAGNEVVGEPQVSAVNRDHQVEPTKSLPKEKSDPEDTRRRFAEKARQLYEQLRSEITAGQPESTQPLFDNILQRDEVSTRAQDTEPQVENLLTLTKKWLRRGSDSSESVESLVPIHSGQPMDDAAPQGAPTCNLPFCDCGERMKFDAGARRGSKTWTCKQCKSPGLSTTLHYQCPKSNCDSHLCKRCGDWQVHENQQAGQTQLQPPSASSNQQTDYSQAKQREYELKSASVQSSTAAAYRDVSKMSSDNQSEKPEPAEKHELAEKKAVEHLHPKKCPYCICGQKTTLICQKRKGSMTWECSSCHTHFLWTTPRFAHNPKCNYRLCRRCGDWKVHERRQEKLRRLSSSSQDSDPTIAAAQQQQKTSTAFSKARHRTREFERYVSKGAGGPAARQTSDKASDFRTLGHSRGEAKLEREKVTRKPGSEQRVRDIPVPRDHEFSASSSQFTSSKSHWKSYKEFQHEQMQVDKVMADIERSMSQLRQKRTSSI